MLFLSDDMLAREQRQATWNAREWPATPAELRREAIEDAREMRAHQRLRDVAKLLLVLPVWVGLLYALAEWIAGKLMTS